MTMEMLEKRYPIGTQVKYTGDYPIRDGSIIKVKKGDVGTVIGTNPVGDLRISWENGNIVLLTPGKDHFSMLYTNKKPF